MCIEIVEGVNLTVADNQRLDRFTSSAAFSNTTVVEEDFWNRAQSDSGRASGTRLIVFNGNISLDLYQVSSMFLVIKK